MILRGPTHLRYNQDVREDDGGIKWKSSQRLKVNKKKREKEKKTLVQKNKEKKGE